MCMADYNDGDWTSLPATRPRAKQDHRCDECGRTIAQGERYERSAGIGEGIFYSSKTCEHCLAARSWLNTVCHGWLYEAVLMDLEEHWDESFELRSWWLGRIIVRMKRRWTRRDGSLMPVPSECPEAWTLGLLSRGAAA